MNFSLAKEIYGQPWLIDAVSIQHLSALLDHFKQGGALTPGEKCNNTFIFDLKNNVMVTDQIWEPKRDETENKYIAVTYLNGPITKGGGESSYGTVGMAAKFKRFDKMDNIIGHIIKTDSGGGSGDAVKYLRDAILQSEKPVIGFGEDLVASAAYYILTAVDYIIMNDPDARVGSIGTMIEFEHFKKVDQNKLTGERYVRIYADESTEKNNGFEEAINNLNFTPIKERLLNPMNDRFINDVISSRPNVDASQLKGGLFFAKEAVGTLIDAIGTFEQAVEKVVELSNKAPNSGTINNQKSKQMTKAELKAEHPEVYNEIVAEGVKSEQKRVRSLLKFADIDQKSVNEAILDGTDPDQEFFADMTVKSLSKKQLETEQNESPGEVQTKKVEEPETKQDDALVDFKNKALAAAGLKIEEV